MLNVHARGAQRSRCFGKRVEDFRTICRFAMHLCLVLPRAAYRERPQSRPPLSATLQDQTHELQCPSYKGQINRTFCGVDHRFRFCSVPVCAPCNERRCERSNRNSKASSRRAGSERQPRGRPQRTSLSRAALKLASRYRVLEYTDSPPPPQPWLNGETRARTP